MFDTANSLKGKIMIDLPLESFFKLNPPCKQCLIQNMCIYEDEEKSLPHIIPSYLLITVCKKLLTFFKNSDRVNIESKELEKIKNILNT